MSEIVHLYHARTLYFLPWTLFDIFSGSISATSAGNSSNKLRSFIQVLTATPLHKELRFIKQGWTDVAGFRAPIQAI